jgi:hypothetical protein
VPNTIDDARRLITTRLADIDAEAKSLERAVVSLGDGSQPRTRRPGRLRGAATAASAPSKPKPRAPRGRRREELLTAIKAIPGARPTDLAKTIGIPQTQVHALIAKARAEKLVVKKGNGYALRT